MYSIRHVTLAGSECYLHTDRPLTRESAPSIGSFGATFTAVDNETIAVRTSDRETCLAILRHDMDTQADIASIFIGMDWRLARRLSPI